MKCKKASVRFAKVLKASDNIKVCQLETGGCGHEQPKFTKSGLSIKVEYGGDANEQVGRDK